MTEGRHIPPEQLDLFPETFKEQPMATTSASAEQTAEGPTVQGDEQQLELGVEQIKKVETIAEKERRIQQFLTGEKKRLELSTIEQRAEYEGEYHQGFHRPSDEHRIEFFYTLVGKNEEGPTLVTLHPQTTIESQPKKKKGKKTKRPTTLLTTPELYYCPNGINGSTDGLKIKPGTKAEEFIKQWNTNPVDQIK